MAAAPEPAQLISARSWAMCISHGPLQDADAAYREAIRLDARNPEYREVEAGRNLLRLDRETAQGFGKRSPRPAQFRGALRTGRIASAARDDAVARLHLEASAAIDRDAGSRYQSGPALPAARRSHSRFRIDAKVRATAQPGPAISRRYGATGPGDRGTGERRWGRYQFPTVHGMADGRLISLFTWRQTPAESYGCPADAGVFR